jgi:hypothetical protein
MTMGTVLLNIKLYYELQNSCGEGWAKELRITSRIRRNLPTFDQNPCYLGERHRSSWIAVGS